MLNEYLSNTVSRLKSNNYAELNIVLGNESCDLDSAISTLVYATFLHWQYQQLKSSVSVSDEATYKDDIFVPILNVNREDFELKTEVAYAFKHHDIIASDLIFRDDTNLEDEVTKRKTNVILVDHHILSKKDEFLLPYVTEIIDHRPLDKAQWKYREDTRSTIEIAGSCCTLVAQRILDLSSLMSKDIQFFKEYPDCSDFLHCTIVLDTVNFSKEVNKATPHDEEIVKFVENILQTKNCDEQRRRKLAQYLDARRDVSSLTPSQLLRKDTKIIGDVYVPSFPILVKVKIFLSNPCSVLVDYSLKDFLQKPEAVEKVIETLNNSGCSTALLLGMCLVDELQRDVAVLSIEESKAMLLSKHLQEWSSPTLQLTPEELPNVSGCHYFKQLNLAASRKQYIPALNKFLGFV